MDRILSWLTLLMVFTTFIIVVLRYAFNSGWIALQEASRNSGGLPGVYLLKTSILGVAGYNDSP